MEIAFVSIAALTASVLTFFSGFGLGTLLMPVFALFFPVDVSVALTAIVHFLNNLFKLVLVGKFARREIIVRFGIPAIFAAVVGAWALSQLSNISPVATYSVGEKEFAILWVKIVIALVMVGFTLFELIPALRELRFKEAFLPIGGVLSGFFGGLSGHQGALRSAFLSRLPLSKESFIGTGVVIACLIDVARMSVYSVHLSRVGYQENLMLLVAATASAFIGSYLGSVFLRKVTMGLIQQMIAGLLLVLSMALAAGVV